MPTHEELISKYLKLRDEKTKVEDRHKVELAKYREAMGWLEGQLKKILQEQNLQHISSKEATAFLKRSTSATLADTGVFREFIISNSNFELADFRPKKEAVEEYIREHDGSPPPGVNFSAGLSLLVQRR